MTVERRDLWATDSGTPVVRALHGRQQGLENKWAQMQARVRQHQARMIQTPLPPEEKIQIQCAWTPLRLKIPVTTKPSLKLMKLREQLQCRSFGGGALHTCKEHHSIAIQRLSRWPAHRSRLQQWRPGAAHIS